MNNDQPETSATYHPGIQPVAGTDARADASAPDAQTSAIEPMWELIRRLPSYVRLATAMGRDSRVPAPAKAMLLGGGAYLVSPIDLVPGIIPVAGQLDDLYVVLTGLQQAMRMTPQPVVDEHLAAAGLTAQNISDDLASIRLFVRKGVARTFQKGGLAVAGISRQAVNLLKRARSWGETRLDQKPL